MKIPTDPRAAMHRTCMDGTQTIFKFKNNLGASVICHKGSYGYPELFELAVIRYAPGIANPLKFDLDYSNPGASDVLGFLNDEDVSRILDEIENLNE